MSYFKAIFSYLRLVTNCFLTFILNKELSKRHRLGYEHTNGEGFIWNINSFKTVRKQFNRNLENYIKDNSHNGFKIMMIKFKLGNVDIDFLLFSDGTHK